jgi:hypothetical protein
LAHEGVMFGERRHLDDVDRIPVFGEQRQDLARRRDPEVEVKGTLLGPIVGEQQLDRPRRKRHGG